MGKIKARIKNVDIRPFREVNLLVSPLMFDDMPVKIKVYPFTMGDEIQIYSSIKSIIEDKTPNKLFGSFEIFIELAQRVLDEDFIEEYFDKLTLFDLEWIIYNSRMLTHGNIMEGTWTCTSCANKYKNINEIDEHLRKNPIVVRFVNNGFKTDFEYDLSKFQLKFPNSKDEVRKELKLSNIRLILSYPTIERHNVLYKVLDDYRLYEGLIKEVEGEKYLNKLKEDKEMYDIIYYMFQMYAFYSMYIEEIEIDGKLEKVELDDYPYLAGLLLKELSNEDKKILEDEINKLSENTQIISLNEVTCPVCGRRDVIPYSFFLGNFLFASNR